MADEDPGETQVAKRARRRKAGPAASGDETASTKSGVEKVPRSPGERAASALRSAKRSQREVTDPAERAQFLLAEANVLALLELAEALRDNSAGGQPG